MGQKWWKFFNSGQTGCAEQQFRFGGVAASILVDIYIFSKVPRTLSPHWSQVPMLESVSGRLPILLHTCAKQLNLDAVTPPGSRFERSCPSSRMLLPRHTACVVPGRERQKIDDAARVESRARRRLIRLSEVCACKHALYQMHTQIDRIQT